MTDKKSIYCGVKDPKPNQRRCTMKEAADLHQVRYYGIKRIDKVLVDQITGKTTKKKPEYTLEEAVGKANGLKTRALHIMDEINKMKKKGEDTTTKQKEYEKTKKEYIKMVPIANKLIEQSKKH